jgi:hypothetical protein
LRPCFMFFAFLLAQKLSQFLLNISSFIFPDECSVTELPYQLNSEENLCYFLLSH